MEGLTLFLSKALLCASFQCWPVLVGPSTPIGGPFPLRQRYTADPGYGSDILQFREDEKYVWAIHRVYTLNPKEKRKDRLRDPNPKNRFITQGCINVDPDLYNYLVLNFRSSTLTILP